MLKIIHVNFFDCDGGAARAAHRLHQGMRRIGLDSQMVVLRKLGDDPHVHGVSEGNKRIVTLLRQRAANMVLRGQHSPNTIRHSLNIFPSGLANWLNRSDADIVNLHWLGHETMSIAEMGAIKKPVVWTMHDMWPFSGAEHYDDLDAPGRWRSGYLATDRALAHTGFDLDAWTFRRKQRAWKNQTFHLASPSHWLADCARQSALFSRMPIRVIHNGIDLDVYKPVDRAIARGILNLPSNRRLILFGALDSISDARKGFQLLQPALVRLAALGWKDQAELLIFGASTPKQPPDFELPAHYLGRFSDDIALNLLYAAADVFVSPSMQDNLSNTLVESLASGTPCVAFDIGGMRDLIEPGQTGFLARPFDTDEFALGIDQVLRSDAAAMRHACRTQAIRRFGDLTAAGNYQDYYQQILGDCHDGQ